MAFVKYSPDVKVLVIRLCLKGHSPAFINHMLGLNISEQLFVRWMKLFERTQCVVCNPDYYETRGAPRILSSEDREFVSEILDADPTLYLDEMARQLLEAKGVDISIAALAIEVRDRLAMTLKVARTVHPNQNAELRANFFQVIADIPSESLIFLDKSAIAKRNLYRKRGQAKRGQRTKRLLRPTFSNRYTLLPAMSMSGCLSLKVQEGSFCREDFEDYLAHHLLPMTNPWPQPNSCIVLDNASIHHGGNIDDLCAELGVRIVYLPPYSPDFNPIEKAFAVIKDRLCQSQLLTTAVDAEEEMEMIYITALEVITPELAINLFHGSIYP